MAAKRRFQRARKPEEKALRREAVLRAARALALEVGPMALSLNELGRRSGVSKPNIYRYFEGREAVLLQLFVSELEALVGALEAELVRARARAAVAAALARAFLARPLLCQLLGMVAGILEHHLSVEAIAASKRQLHALGARAAAALGRALPRLDEEALRFAVSSLTLYVSALWPAAYPSDNAAQVLARPEFAPHKPDAPRELERFIEVLLAGLQALPSPVQRAKR